MQSEQRESMCYYRPWLDQSRNIFGDRKASIRDSVSFLLSSGSSTAGAIARNSSGLVFLSASKRLRRCNSVEEAEARAAQFGIQELAKIYNGPMVLELDCCAVVHAMQADGEPKSAILAMVCNIKETLKSFQTVLIRPVGRNGNKATHHLAALARESGDLSMIGRAPDCIQSVLQEDRNTQTG